MDAFWLLGEAVGIAAGCGPEVDSHHHEKRLLLRDVWVGIVLQITERGTGSGWGSQARLSEGLHPALLCAHCRQKHTAHSGSRLPCGESWGEGRLSQPLPDQLKERWRCLLNKGQATGEGPCLHLFNTPFINCAQTWLITETLPSGLEPQWFPE